MELQGGSGEEIAKGPRATARVCPVQKGSSWLLASCPASLWRSAPIAWAINRGGCDAMRGTAVAPKVSQCAFIRYERQDRLPRSK